MDTKSIEIWHNTRCGTSRNVLQRVIDAGFSPVVREYLVDKPTREELTDLLKKLQLKPSDLIRKKEALYQEKIKGNDWSEARLLTAMVKNPVLIERPILIQQKRAVIGRSEESILEILSIK